MKEKRWSGVEVRTVRCVKKCVSLKEKKRGLYVHVYAGKVLQKKLNKRDDTRTNKEEKKRRNAKVAAANVTICYC